MCAELADRFQDVHLYVCLNNLQRFPMLTGSFQFLLLEHLDIYAYTPNIVINDERFVLLSGQ